MMTIYARIENGVVFELYETDLDINDFVHPSLVWVPCSGEVRAGWLYDGGFSSPPEVSNEELARVALEARDSLLREAAIRVDPLQDAVDHETATPAEVVELKKWKQYRVDLNRIDGQSGWPSNFEWPAQP